MMARRRASVRKKSGKLRIGDDWNAITIIALSQSNPLKAVAEFVENSIDARARNVVITRGQEQGAHYLKISDDGEGIPRDPEGVPDFRYVATHICDSIKRQLKTQGEEGIQGEFGIGLLSFWTVGEELVLSSAGADGTTYRMHMKKGDPNYRVSQSRRLFPTQGTELTIRPLLHGPRLFSGEKIQWYLASELRDRIRRSAVRIRVVDRRARREFQVEPRQFSGRLLQQLPTPEASRGEVYVELYLAESDGSNRVGLYRSGTRVLEDLAQLAGFQNPPWTDGRIQGIVDAPFLNLTPGTRTGVIQDGAYAEFCFALEDTTAALKRVIEEQDRAEEERTSRQILRTIQKAFKEAFLALPPEEYDWFDIRGRDERGVLRQPSPVAGVKVSDSGYLPVEESVDREDEREQKKFFEYAGPLFSARISPASSVLPVDKSRQLRGIARDRSGRQVDEDLQFAWEIVEGEGRLENENGEIVTFEAPPIPGLSRVQLTVSQQGIVAQAEAMITVTDSILPESKEASSTREGLPGYTLKRSPGELWRSRYDRDQNVIVINSGHRDFVFASRSKALKLRYIIRLFAKELVLSNFPGYSPNELLERMIELSLYTEEHLK